MEHVISHDLDEIHQLPASRSHRPRRARTRGVGHPPGRGARLLRRRGRALAALQMVASWRVLPLGLATIGTTDLGTVHEPGQRGRADTDVCSLEDGDGADALLAADLQGWLFIPSRGEQRPSAVLGFDTLRPGPIARPGELSLLRMACDAIENAVARESLERDRERLEANLQHARRMETVGALTSGIAHNFNNIIGAILGYTETAQAYVGPERRSMESLSRNPAGGRASAGPRRPDPHFRPRRSVALHAGVSARRSSPRRSRFWTSLSLPGVKIAVTQGFRPPMSGAPQPTCNRSFSRSARTPRRPWTRRARSRSRSTCSSSPSPCRPTPASCRRAVMPSLP